MEITAAMPHTIIGELFSKKKVKCSLHLKTVKKTQILFNGEVLSIVGFILGCLIPCTTSFVRPLFSGLEKFKRVKKLIW